jgi:hypothetical protein
VSALRRWANRHGLVFPGTDPDVQKLAEWVAARGAITPEIFQTDQVGMHSPPPDYRFAGPSVVYPGGWEGRLPWRYAPGAAVEDADDQVLLPDTLGREFSWSWLEAFLSLSEAEVTHPLLAWVVAAMRRPEVREFPILFIGGSSGVGKSTLARLVCQLGGSRSELDLGANTPFVLLRKLASSTSLPVFIDEWTRMSREDTRRTLQGHIPILYTGGTAQRGQADLGAAVYKLTAPTVIAGEDTFTLDRELDRIIPVAPSRRAQNHEALAAVLGQPLELFAKLMHRWLTTPRDHALPSLSTGASARPAHNRGVLEAGWRTLRLFLSEAAQLDPDVPVVPDEPDLGCLDPGRRREDENVYEVALAEASSMTDRDGLPFIWLDDQGRGTWVRFMALVREVDNRLDLGLPGRSGAMRDYFTERYGELRDGRVTPPGAVKSVRAHLIPGFQLPAGELDALSKLIAA